MFALLCEETVVEQAKKANRRMTNRKNKNKLNKPSITDLTDTTKTEGCARGACICICTLRVMP